MNKPVKYGITGFILVCLTLLITAGVMLYSAFQKAASDDPLVWESDIKNFENLDRENMPHQEGILFVGSSSFRFWKNLKDDMKDLPVINRGFGGSKLPDLIHYAHRIILPYKPKIVVIYCGDNDMSVGRLQSSEEVLGNTKRLIAVIKEKLPAAIICYVSIKPSPSRMKFWPAMKRANRQIKNYLASQKNMVFIDVSSRMFRKDGSLKDELFTWDRIHMRREGYVLWTEIIRPVVAKQFK